MTQGMQRLLTLLTLAFVLFSFICSVAAFDREQPGKKYAPVVKSPPEPARPTPARDLDLTLEQAVFLVLKNDRDLQIQQYEPLIAGTFEQIELGAFDPEAFADLSWAREMDDRTTRDRTLEAMAGVTKKFSTGTRLTADLAWDKDASEESGSRHNTRAEITVTQALLQGRGAAVNLARVRQRKIDTLASVYELKGFTEALVAQTEIAYWHHVLAQKEIAVFQRSLEVATQQREEIEQQIEVGFLPENEVAAARAEEAIREQALINARSLVEERRLALLRLIHADRADIRVNTLSRPAVHAHPMADTGERIQLALACRPDLKEAELALSRDALEVMVTKNGMLPKLDFFMNLGVNGFGNSLGKSIAAISSDAYDIGAGLSIRRFLFNREARARHEAATISRRKARTAIDNLKHHIRFQVSLAVNEAERARQQIFASRKTREYEEQTVVSEKERFNVGAGTSLLVARAQRDLLASQIAEVRAVIDYRIALVKLFLAEGSLLERRGISL